MPLLQLRDGFSGSFRRTVVTTLGSGDVPAVTRLVKWVPGRAIEVSDAEAKSIATDIGETPDHSLRVVKTEQKSPPDKTPGGNVAAVAKTPSPSP